MEHLAVNLIILITVLLAGVPVPLAFAAAAIHMVLVMGVNPSFLLPIGYVKLHSVTILSVLFFIMLGGVMTTGGLSRRLLGFTEIFVGRMKCGLGVISIVTCAMFGAISGTASSAVAAIWPQGLAGIALNKDPKSLGDPNVPKGIKIRAPGLKAFEVSAEVLGYIPTPIPFAETFTAIQTGVVDGESGGGPYQAWSTFRDVTKVWVQYNDYFEV